MKNTLAVFPVVAMLSFIFSIPANALECPPFPQQASKDSETKVKAEVGKIGPLRGGELETQVKTVTKELLSSLPSGDRVYLEQMMYAAYCTGLRDDRQLSESGKTQQLRIYNHELRQAIGKSQEGSKPPLEQKPSEGKRLFFDNFSRDTHQWEVSGSEAKVIDGMFAVIGRPLVVALVGEPAWRNYSVRAKVKLISDNPDFGILVAANEDCNFYHVQFIYRDKFASFENNSVNLVRTEGKGCLQGFSWKKLSSKPFRIKRDQWLNIRVDFQGTRITGYVNDSQVISVEDAFYTQGKVGLRADETQVFVRDFEVVSLANP